jgi:hypothetical protein
MTKRFSYRHAKVSSIVLVSLATLLTGAFSALAVTSIGTDISTGGTLSVSGNATFDTSTLYVNATANHVGILTTSPSSELDVRDNSASPSTNIFQVANLNDSTRYLTVSSTATAIQTLNVSGNTTLGDAAGDTLAITGTAVSIPNALNIGSNALYVNASTQQVGVGTNSLSSVAGLQVHYAAGNGSGIVITDLGSGTSDSNGMAIFFDSTANEASWINYENGPIVWHTNGGSSEKMRLSSTGNLAIGTTNTDPRFNIRASSTSPTTNLFQISNSNDSSRYLYVNSTGTTVTNLTVTGTCTGCASSSTLNQTYLAATGTTEISITPSLGALTIADTLSGTGNVFEVQNRTTSAGDYSQRYLTVSATAVGIFSNTPNATLTVQNLNPTGGTVLDLRTNGSSIFSVDYQGNVVGDRSLTVSRTAQFAEVADEYWPYPGLAIIPQSTFAQDLIQTKTGTTYRFVVKSTGFVGIMTSTPSAELDVRDTASVPTSNIFQVANLNDSSRYFTVSSTSTSIQTDVNLENGTGTVSTDAVTVNAASGVITDSTDIALSTTRAAITLTNSRISATSVVLVSNCSTPDSGAMLVAAVAPGAGSATLTVRNVGLSNQTSDWKLCFVVTN